MSLRPHKQQSQQVARAISIEHSSSYPCGSISIEQASSIVCPCGLSRTKNRSSAAGVDLWWSANHRMKWFRATRRSGFLFFPEGRRPRWEVDPPLRVREDWWVFEDLLRFKEALVGFRKKQRASSPLANPWVKAGSSPHKKPQLRCWRRPLMVRQPYSEAVWAPSRAVGTSPVPWGERGLGKAVEPSLMVKKDGLILEKNLRFKEVLVVFRRFKKLLLVFRMSRKYL